MRTLAGLMCLFACCAPARAQSRIAYARFELSGPLSQAELELAPGSRTELTGELLAGERVERELPVAVDELGARGEPRLVWQGDPGRAGRAHFLGWVRTAEERWAALPPALRARSRPPVLPQDARPPLALWLLLASCALCSAALSRKHAAGAALPALAGCALAWLLGSRHEGDFAGTWIVLEGAGARTPWVEQRAQWEELVLPPETGPVLLATEPAQVPLVLETTLGAEGPLSIRARGAALFASRTLDPGPGTIAASAQDCSELLAPVWWREDGEWTCRSSWKRGEPLPPAQPGGAPPGWLATGLPQGPRVCIAQSGGPRPVWFRDVGP